ncbi:hypothetical protein ACQ4LE_001038, partial [Meloidogyne hapla]
MCQNIIIKIQLKLFIYLLFLPLICLSEEIIKHCNSDDLIFQYTACDQNDKRWLFAVPRSHDFLCTPESVPAPLHGLNCSVTCPAGHFLEMNSQKCKLCKPGTFSLGNRVRYEEFESLPEGFSVENSPDDSFGGKTIKCSGGGWNVEGNQLRYSWTPCVSTLSISLHLTRPGFAEFKYQISRESKGLIQMLQVRNAQCQSYGNSKSLLFSQQQQQNNKQLKKENNDETFNQQDGADIRVQKLSLRRGQNLITWTLAVNPVLSSRMEMIRIIRIDISGLAFAPECSLCPEGTFSSVHGAQHCEPCGENEFAQKGSKQCQQCPPNMWSEPRSGFCQKRPICSPLDFYPARPSICINSSHENLKIFWRKLNPQICIDNGILNNLSNENEKCLPCGPGMQRNNAGYCELCPKGFINSFDGKSCIPCPSGSIPNYGIFLTNWDSLPPGIELKKECEFLSAEIPNECPVNPSWISYGNRLESATTRMKGVALEMNIKLKEGFSSPLHTGKINNENPLGKISIEISLQCKGNCQFYIVQKIEKQKQQFIFPEKEENLQLLKMLNGNHSNKLLIFPILNSFPIHLFFAFTRSNAILGNDEINDKAIIYSINITNNENISDNYCIKCPIFENGKCLPCPSGEYFDKKKCKRCPQNTIINQTEYIYLLSNNSNNLIPCSKCPKYFQNSNDGLSCEFSGKFDLEDEEEKINGINSKKYFDLSLLKGIPLSAKGIRIFARDGQSFTHIFNFSLFPNYPIKCKDSIPTKRQIEL